jgi:hypothetical protein
MVHWLFTVPRLIDWSNDYAEKVGMDYRILSYLGSRPDMLYYLPVDSDDDIKAFPSPRSWSFVNRLIKDVPSSNLKMIANLVGMAVGRARGQEFASFLEVINKWNIAECYKTGKVDIPAEMDEIYALASGLIGYYKERMNKKENDKMIVTLANLACQFPAEDTALIISTTKATDKEFFEKLRTLDPEAHLRLIKVCAKVVA